MNSQFHTPSLGDEVFDLSGIDDVGANHTLQQEYSGSKRLQNMDQHFSVSGGGNVNFSAGGMNAIVKTEHNFASLPTQNTATPTTLAARKQLSPGVTDPNEPAKPLSPYAYFFRDTVSTIKQQNPTCNFEELTSIVASMWEVLDPVQKDVYQKKAQIARAEYCKQLRLYQQRVQTQPQPQLQQQQNNIVSSTSETFANTDQQPVTIVNSNNATNQAAATNQMQDASQHCNDIKPNVNHAPEVKSEEAEVIEITNGVETCIREGCERLAVMNPDWEDEYCSNECVVIHCRNVFNAWVQQNKEAAAT